MSDDYEEQLRLDELLRTLSETKAVAPKLIEKGRNLAAAGQKALDWANALEAVAKNSPDGFFSDPMFTTVSSGFAEFNNIARKQNQQIEHDEQLIMVTGTNATATGVSSTSAAIRLTVEIPSEVPHLKPLIALMRRHSDADSVKETMRQLGLSAKRASARSPVQLLESAQQALDRPFVNDGYETAVLVPLREAIQVSIDELLKQRRQTTATGGWQSKVQALAEQLGKGPLSQDHINRVALNTHALINQLSGGKSRAMSREHIASLFDLGISLLQDILALVDPSKFR